MNAELDYGEVMKLVDSIGQKIFGCKGKTYPPKFVKEREDICVVKHDVVVGRKFYEVLFLVWRNLENQTYCVRIDNFNNKLTDLSRDFINITDVKLGNGQIIIKVASGGTSSGKGPWDKVIQLPVDTMEC